MTQSLEMASRVRGFRAGWDLAEQGGHSRWENVAVLGKGQSQAETRMNVCLWVGGPIWEET